MAALSPTVDINQNPLAAAQFANTYGAQTQQALRRSQYLADALKTLTTEGAQNIRSPWELGAKLLATAIMQRANNKGQDALIKAMQADQQDETTRLLGPLQSAIQPAQPVPQAAPQPAPQPAPEPPPAPEQPQPTGLLFSPQDRDALTRMIATEAGGEGPMGMLAAGHVALNRLKSGYGGAKSLSDVVYAPHQFEGITRANSVRPQDYASAQAVADQLLSGQAPDPTNGATHFLNPDLQVQLGRQIPEWARGNGQRIGRHVFFGGQPDVQMTSGPAPQGPMQISPSMEQANQSYQVASAGPTPPPPSAPGSSPSAGGTPPAATPPQATAAGGWPTWKPSQQEYDYVQGLLMDPRTHAVGVQEALKMRQKMTQPVEATVQIINGVPFYVPKDPTAGAPTAAIPVPREAMTQHLDGPAGGLPAGVQQDVSPLGNRNTVYKPPEGYQSDGQGGLVPQRNGPADPTRVQTPPPGYQFSGGHYAPIPGGPYDLTAPQNVAQGTMRYSEMVKPIVDAAMKVRQNYGAVTTGYRQQNGTGDIAMVNGLQKLIDEGVVRGEDVNLQMKSNGIAGSIGSLSQYLQSGGLLTPDVRDKLYRTANDLYKNLDTTYRSRVMSIKPGVDKLYGEGAFDTYVFPQPFADQMGWGAASTQPDQGGGPPTLGANAPAGSADAVLAEAVRRKLPLSPAQQARAKRLGLIP
ncbi:cell wall hydrolase [Phenylobacterium soli]|uniref:Cell wall hydrolase SleB domain-containing protein n=1 Tax=Phenylobacterium soli TaxID=2170551 RepID=A0A328A964_9CAUL|nr:cell wall hydrolase [Phenylobacterium soli]RAK51192.1 hypothetical protein DJ017_19735 [Phenylobacterium soli]